MAVNITLNEDMCEEIFRQILKIDFEEHCLWTSNSGWRTGQSELISDDSDKYDEELDKAYKVLLNHYYNELEAAEIIEAASKLTREDQLYDD